MTQEQIELVTSIGFGTFEDVYTLMFVGFLNGMNYITLWESS